MVSSDNPYVGPRPFSQTDADRFFGREREARDLTALVISQRLTLFYAQSGAGKSSLLNARVIPALRSEGFVVLPVGRVGGAPQKDVTAVANIFVYNLAASILQSGPADAQRDPLTDLALSHFLAGLTSDDGGATWRFDGAEVDAPADGAGAVYSGPPTVLVIDQFEELLAYYPERWEDRADFFRQLDAALREDPRLWVVLTLREDYVASLDPYIPLVESRLRARYFMPRMGVDAALAAVRKPAEQAGRTFAPGVAEWLVDNLRLVRAQTGHGAVAPGEFVEPVQLQVVCYQWWASLPPDVATMELAYVEQVAQGAAIATFVDRALADFYERVLAEALALHRGQVTDQELRAWFSDELITEARTRGLLFQGETRTGSVPNAVVRDLETRFLVRAVARAGGLWYELVHDRLVEPILAANRARQTPLRSDAEAWLAAGRVAQKLYGGRQLWEAAPLLETHAADLSALEQEFLRASVEADAQRQRELAAAQALAEEQWRRAEEQTAYAAQLRRRNRWFAVALAVAVMLLAAAVFFFVQSQQNAAQARSAEAEAQANLAVAEMAKATAQANADLATDQLQALAGEQLLAAAKQYKADLDATNAISSFTAAATYPKLKLDLSAEISDTLRYVATQLVQEGEALARQGDREGAAVKFQAAFDLKPPPDTPVYVWIEDGEFVMGSTDEDSLASDNEKPAHRVQLDGYWIQRTEVTNEQYKRCVDAGACTMPYSIFWDKPRSAKLPVVFVDWEQANTYAAWVGGRLPTEAEWELACRSDDGRIYPWGDEPPALGLLNYDYQVGGSTDVSSYPSGVHGLYDMAGNVAEWTADWYADDYYRQLADAIGDAAAVDPNGPTMGEYRTLRGGSWGYGNHIVRCAGRLDADPGSGNDDVGFRVLSPGF
jgi:formylglycine-generating enzyme required for sulfatase activity